jgi:hypothetical protein
VLGHIAENCAALPNIPSRNAEMAHCTAEFHFVLWLLCPLLDYLCYAQSQRGSPNARVHVFGILYGQRILDDLCPIYQCVSIADTVREISVLEVRPRRQTVPELHSVPDCVLLLGGAGDAVFHIL